MPVRKRVLKVPRAKSALGTAPKKDEKVGWENVLAKLESSKKYAIRRGWKDRSPFCVPCPLQSVNVISPYDQDGIFGPPAGTIISLIGDYKDGKDSLLNAFMIGAQKEDPLGRRPPMKVARIETEREMGAKWAASMGLVVEDIVEPAERIFNLEQALGWTLNLLMTSAAEPREHRVPWFIGISSLSNLLPAETMAKDVEEEGKIAAFAKNVWRSINQMTPYILETNSIVAFISQKTEIIPGRANNWTGGRSHRAARAINAAASVVYEVDRRYEKGEDSEDFDERPTKTLHHVYVKQAIGTRAGGKSGPLYLHYLNGWDVDLSLFFALKILGLITSAGGWHTVTETVNVNGKGYKLKWQGDDGLGKLKPEIKSALHGLVRYREPAKEKTE